MPRRLYIQSPADPAALRQYNAVLERWFAALATGDQRRIEREKSRTVDYLVSCLVHEDGTPADLDQVSAADVDDAIKSGRVLPPRTNPTAPPHWRL